MPLRSFVNFRLMIRHRKELRGALGHGLCVNPSLPVQTIAVWCNKRRSWFPSYGWVYSRYSAVQNLCVHGAMLLRQALLWRTWAES